MALESTCWLTFRRGISVSGFLKTGVLLGTPRSQGNEDGLEGRHKNFLGIILENLPCSWIQTEASHTGKGWRFIDFPDSRLMVAA